MIILSYHRGDGGDFMRDAAFLAAFAIDNDENVLSVFYAFAMYTCDYDALCH